MGKKEKRELSEDAAMEIAHRDHPEWNKDELPEEVTGEDGKPMNPFAHLTIHAVVERQLAADVPEGVSAIADELQQLGVSRHEIRHVIGSVMAEHIWYMQKERCVFDEGRYMADLRKIVDTYR